MPMCIVRLHLQWRVNQVKHSQSVMLERLKLPLGAFLLPYVVQILRDWVSTIVFQIHMMVEIISDTAMYRFLRQVSTSNICLRSEERRVGKERRVRMT